MEESYGIKKFESEEEIKDSQPSLADLLQGRTLHID
jgi:hypothetical protein